MAGRPAAPTCITNNNNILPGTVLETLDCTPKSIYNYMEDHLVWLQWIAKRRLICNSNVCTNCQRAMCLVRRAESPDGFSWKCRDCNTQTSIRTGSFFANCGLSTETIVMFYYWVHDVKATHVMLFEEIDNWDIMVNYNNFFRLECRKVCWGCALTYLFSMPVVYLHWVSVSCFVDNVTVVDNDSLINSVFLSNDFFV